MARISNHSFPNVFVFAPASELITTNTKKPTDLTKGQVGIFDASTGLGVGSSPDPDTLEAIFIAQNVGDNKFGPVRTRTIYKRDVRSWYGKVSHVPLPQVSYIGYDQSDSTKNISIYKGQNAVIPITIFSNDLKRWYGPQGYTHRILLDVTNCAPCASNCDIADYDAVADAIVNEINGGGAPANSFPVNTELRNYMHAVKVTTGTQGNANYRVGVKITTDVTPISQPDINKCDPQQFYESKITTFVIGNPLNCPYIPITYSQKAKVGNGFGIELQDLEKESQGYSRVREAFEYSKFMKDNYYIRAKDDTYYDFYYLSFESEHRSSQVTGPTRDRNLTIFGIEHGDGGPLEDILNDWLNPPFADVVLSSGSES